MIFYILRIRDGSGICQGGTWRARGAQAYNGGLGQSPQGGPGAELLVGVQGAKPPEAESFSSIQKGQTFSI